MDTVKSMEALTAFVAQKTQLCLPGMLGGQ